MIDPILPEEASPPPPVLPFESSPPSDPNDMDIDDIEDARLEFQSTEESPKQGKTSSDGFIDPDALIVSHQPNVALDEHVNRILPPTMDNNKQTPPNDFQPPIQQNQSSEKITSKGP